MRRDGDLTTLAPPFFKQFLIADVGQLRLAHRGDVHAIDQYLPAARRIEAGDDAEHGRFPGAGRPDNRHELAAFDAKADPVQDIDPLPTERETARDLPRFQGGGHSRTGPTCYRRDHRVRAPFVVCL